MSGVIRTILAELERADDQGRDWYGWATNQLGHAFGYMAIATVVAALWAPDAGTLVAIGLAVAKELFDGFRTDNRQGWKDCAVDLFFSATGAALVAFGTAWDLIALAAMAAALVAGIVKRIQGRGA